MKVYGHQVCFDVANVPFVVNRQWIQEFMSTLVKFLGMEAGPLYFWDYVDDDEAYKVAPSHLKGTSAVQFISTSSIVLHSLDDLRTMHIDIFTCGELDAEQAKSFVEKKVGKVITAVSFERSMP